MHNNKNKLPAALLALTAIIGISNAGAQQIELSSQTWSAEVIRDDGQPVIPLFDGWYPNADGSKTICFGYFNMNREESLDIPRGEDNHLETDYPGLDLSRISPSTTESPGACPATDRI